MNDDIELGRSWRAGDKCRALGMKATIIFIECDCGAYLYHLRADEYDNVLELPHRVFQEHELEAL